MCIVVKLDTTALLELGTSIPLDPLMAPWRSVPFNDESRFQLYRADGRQRVWCHVGKRFDDVSIVNRVPPWC